MALGAGTRLGPYEVVAALGAGGMGEVYRARDTRLGRTVAIKVLPARSAPDPHFRDRFEREARAASALNHPNILSVFDVGRDREVDYLVTEMVDGATLRERIGDHALSVREVVSIGAQIADGLAAAHTAGLVHRDLKPDNVMITRDGRVKILDFGLAKPLDDPIADQRTQTAISEVGMLVGTIGYIAPEQVRGLPASAQSDLFSLGVVFYEMATGRRAFSRPTAIETLSAIVNDDVPELPPALPGGLQRVIGHCLEKEPCRRFQTAADVAFALRSFALTSTTPLPGGARDPGIARRIVYAAISAGAVLFAGGFVAARLSVPPSVDLGAIELVPFAIESPAEFFAAISPDGRSVAYFRSSGELADVLVKSENSPAPTVLSRGHTPGNTPLFWSADGERIYFAEGTRLRSIAAVGGEVHDELDRVNGADLAPDGKTFAALKVNDEVGGREAQLFVGVRDQLRVYEPALVSGAFECTANHVRFSPDGSKILVWAACGGNGVSLVPTPNRQGKGGPARRLWTGQVTSLPQGIDWLKDSRHVVLASGDASGDTLWLGDTRSGALTRLTAAMAPIRVPTVGPDNTVAFTETIEDYDVIELPLAGGAPRPIVNSTRYDGSPAWAPRGGALAYVANRGEGDEIWIRTTADGPERRLLSPRDFPDQTPDWIKALTFSADGQWLAFTAYTATPSLRGGVYVIPASGGAPRLVSPKDALTSRGAWSPDGRTLALYLSRSGPPELWLASIGTSTMRQIPLPPGLNLRDFEWSPKGESIAAFESRPDGGPRATLLIDPADGTVRRLPTLASPVLAWARDGKLLYGIADTATASELRTLDIVTGSVRTVATFNTRLRIWEGIGNARRLSLSPDGRSFVTTVMTNRSNVWLLKGLQPPSRRWWPFRE